MTTPDNSTLGSEGGGGSTSPALEELESSRVTRPPLLKRVPSDYPSDKPSDEPSHEPSDQPSNDPSHGPTAFPSQMPSAMPSGYPSSIPSSGPTGEPSTVLPSATPSLSGPFLSLDSFIAEPFPNISFEDKNLL